MDGEKSAVSPESSKWKRYSGPERLIIADMAADGRSDKEIVSALRSTLRSERTTGGVRMKRHSLKASNRDTVFYSSEEAANMLGIHHSEIRTMVRSKKVGSIKRGRFHYFTDAHVEKIREIITVPPQFVLTGSQIAKKIGIERKHLSRAAKNKYLGEHAFLSRHGWMFTQALLDALIKHMMTETYRGTPRVNIEWETVGGNIR